MKWILKQLKALWAWILKQLKSFWAWLCRLAVAFWNWLLTRSQERWFYLCLSLIFAAFCAIKLKIEWAIWPTAILGFVWEFVRVFVADEFRDFRWKNLVCWIIGGAIMWVIQLI